MSRKRIYILAGVGIGIVLLCGCAAAVAAFYIYTTPMGQPLSIVTETPAPTQELAAGVPGENPVPAAQMPGIPTSTPTANCGHSDSMNMLIMGVDSPVSMGPMGPLAIRMVKVDFGQKNINVFSFPRNLWIPITGLESYGFTQARLGEAYLIARSNAGFSAYAATNLIAQNLYNNFGAFSDHYITAKISTLAVIIDTLGGITVNIPVDYDGTPYGFHYFTAGPYHMTGALALEYATTTSDASQWSGVDRQTLVLQALFWRILSPDVLPKLPALIPQFLQAVTTDLTLQQITDLFCIVQQVPREKMQFTGVGQSDVTMGNRGVLYPNFDSIRAKVYQYL
jgi:LCP family protein required for cell wall assembly